MKQIRIGRHQDNDVTIDDTSVSRHHATIVQTASGFVICDNNSSNGTFINGQRIEGEAILNQNDILKLGTVLVPWKNYFEFNSAREEHKTKIVSEEYEKTINTNNKVPQDNTTSNAQTYITAPKKRKTGLFVALSFTVIGIILIVVALSSRNASINSSFEENYAYAIPVVGEKYVDFVEKGLFDKTLVGYVTITNDSNDAGNVEVIATCSQEGESWDQTEVHYMNPGQTLSLEFEFREVKRLKYNPEFSVIANWTCLAFRES
jgi:pSer/pThr/pTyr-binding forkhead associated (FHA) protein